MTLKYGYLVQPGTFPHKVTPDIDFTNEAVVQFYVQVVQILL